ncbi:uncharacterized protein [Rutidosis leptorrhynchoides]|uniref:uncharacterized protein n=1 Tax=Rutidosis leptorrhynchoides TaxID=125765 RepID=UPI003A996AC7
MENLFFLVQMSDVPPAGISGSTDSDPVALPTATPAAATADTPAPTPTSDPGASTSGAGTSAPAPVSAPGPSRSQPRIGGIEIPAEFGEGPFRNHMRTPCRRTPDGRLVVIPPGRHRQMLAAFGRFGLPAQPPVSPPHDSDDSSADSSSSDDSSDDEDPADRPIQAPSTPPKKRYRFDGTVIPGVNRGRAFTDAFGHRRRVTARKRVVPYPADPQIRKVPRYVLTIPGTVPPRFRYGPLTSRDVPSTSGAGPSTSAPPAPPAPPAPSNEELMREVETLRARVTELEEQLARGAVHPPSP